MFVSHLTMSQNAALKLYRSCLLAAKKIPDPIGASWAKARVMERWRARAGWVQGTKKTTRAIAEGRKSLRTLRAASGGELKPLKKVIEHAYGLRGKTKHILHAQGLIVRSGEDEARRAATTPPVQTLSDVIAAAAKETGGVVTMKRAHAKHILAGTNKRNKRSAKAAQGQHRWPKPLGRGGLSTLNGLSQQQLDLVEEVKREVERGLVGKDDAKRLKELISKEGGFGSDGDDVPLMNVETLLSAVHSELLERLETMKRPKRRLYRKLVPEGASVLSPVLANVMKTDLVSSGGQRRGRDVGRVVRRGVGVVVVGKKGCESGEKKARARKSRPRDAESMKESSR